VVEGIRIFNPQRSSHRKGISVLRGLVKSVDLTPVPTKAYALKDEILFPFIF
jgi:hypothetical protein